MINPAIYFQTHKTISAITILTQTAVLISWKRLSPIRKSIQRGSDGPAKDNRKQIIRMLGRYNIYLWWWYHKLLHTSWRWQLQCIGIRIQAGGHHFPQVFNLLCHSQEPCKLTIPSRAATAHEQTTNWRKSIPSPSFRVKQTKLQRWRVRWPYYTNRHWTSTLRYKRSGKGHL